MAAAGGPAIHAALRFAEEREHVERAEMLLAVTQTLASTSDLPAALDEVLGRADYLALTLALTPDTRGLIGAPQLARLRPTAVLVNVARGEVVDEDALYDALHRRVIAGAAIDVWYRYPAGPSETTAPATLPFGELANVLMTPHSSGITADTFIGRADDIAANIGRLERGEPLRNVIGR